MTAYAVFLRGVNVGGINLRMADVKEALAELPVTDVSTLLASGNAVMRSDLSESELKDAVQVALRARFGYDAWVIVMTADDVDAVVGACPYPADDEDTHTYVTLSSDPAVLDELWSMAQQDGTEHTRLSPIATAWLARVGGTLESPMSKATAKARYKATTTTRNLRTMLKVQAATRKLA
ncbi:DUF1697 domain-containing protein [Sinomonas sp. ASV322]|uniref:DUF1697 domain-containing protein n=1 Tax=Sinomonas sp. ASV322 TaxID=3041920 RepID=UPI0027DE143D|nr:DUF1697 domain-containing protein [Sinomonas sp. ASV322]MDQ4502229.1 DUF1697 domain-containing protein [Sinomonas sp. ASV322]